MPRASKNPQPFKVLNCKTCKQKTIHEKTHNSYPRFQIYRCMLCGNEVTFEGPDYDWWKSLGRR